MTRLWKRSRKQMSQRKQTTHSESTNLSLHSELQMNIDRIKQEIGNSSDVVIQESQLGSNPLLKVAVVYTNGLADKQMVRDLIRCSLLTDSDDTPCQNMAAGQDVFNFVKQNALTIGDIKIIKDWNGLILAILSGDTVILMNGWTEAIIGATKGGETRGVTETTTQVTIRGPKDSFNESIGTNIALVRRRIKSPNLWLESMKIGEVTQTDVAIMYIKGIVDEKVVEEVKQRLQDIKIDGVLESAYVEELIEDQPFSPFPTIYNTERPDVVAANLLEGRVAIFVDGTPFILIVPSLFVQFFQSPEDYYHRYDISLAIRSLRFIGFFISLLGPSVYISAITFHQEMIPTTLLISLAAQREGVPFPAFLEALIMELSFELLREAGVRMPRAVGQAVSIVGALILGQAAVQAGIVSAAMVIAVAITGMTSFSMPSFDLAISARLIRFMLMLMAATYGFFGITIGMIIILAHLCSLRSFGSPYMAPFAPFILKGQKDAILRFPRWSFNIRPRSITEQNRVRMEPNMKPSPGSEGHQDQGDEDEK